MLQKAARFGAGEPAYSRRASGSAANAPPASWSVEHHVMPAHLRERAKELDASPRAQRVAIFTQLSNSLISRPTAGSPGMFNPLAGSAGAAEKEFPQNHSMEHSDWSRAYGGGIRSKVSARSLIESSYYSFSSWPLCSYTRTFPRIHSLIDCEIHSLICIKTKRSGVYISKLELREGCHVWSELFLLIKFL